MSKHTNNKQKSGSPIIWFGATGILLIAALAVVYWAYTENQAQTDAMTAPSASDGLPAYNVPTWIKGDAEAEYQIVAFSDYGCIHCARFHTVVDEFITEYGDLIGFEKRHYPINNNFHSRTAAVTAIAAGKQGKFWEMSNLLYFNTDRWRVENPADAFFGMAQHLELDMEQFEQDMYNEDLMYQVVKGHLAAQEFGINSTPTVYLNGEQIQAPASPEQLYSLLFDEKPAN